MRSSEEDQLLQKLVEEGVTLELCPTSNLNTKVFGSIEEYPIRKLMEAGMRVTVNTDNMTVSGVTLQSEFQMLMDTFSLTEEECKMIVKNAADAAFADQETKDWIYTEIEKRMH